MYIRYLIGREHVFKDKDGRKGNDFKNFQFLLLIIRVMLF